MKIVMLEDLGLAKSEIVARSQKLVDLGHEFIMATDPDLDDKAKIEAVRDADILIVANGALPVSLVEQATRLKFISVGFTGVDHIPLDYCRQHDIAVANAQGYATEATAELTIGLILACLRNIVAYDIAARTGGDRLGRTNYNLAGKTVGIMGTGAIGIRTAQLIQAFGAKVIAYSRSQRQEALDLGIEYVDLDSLLAQSDIISLHLPLTPETKHIIGPEEIEKMKDGVILINCSRGWLINSPALANALKTGKVAQVGLDVLEMEAPIPPNHILLHTPHVTLTPHIGFYTQEALVSRADIVFDNILAWLQGEPVNLV